MVIQYKVVSPRTIYMQATYSAHSMYRFRVGREVGMDLGGVGEGSIYEQNTLYKILKELVR